MTYINGFVAAVPQENKQAYVDHARETLGLFKDHGATRMVENWGDDVPVGKITDFYRSVQKRDGEAVLFSWVEWPSKDVRDSGMKALEQDERMKTLVMPFDGQRMIYGGFSPVVEEGSADGTGYTDGIVAPVPLANCDAYIKCPEPRASSRNAARYAWSRAGAMMCRTARSPISAVRWRPGTPSKQATGQAWPKLMADPRMQPGKDKMPLTVSA